ncbi:MAG TPA: hypothetical protein VHB54_10125 [Mucilaginibacter sp.]|nr:hypothetical protein [Mucilaginibacter sp.]
MKRLSLICLFIYCFLSGLGQTEIQEFKQNILNEKGPYPYGKLINKEFKNELINNDFSQLFTRVENSIVYGFIGDNFQRIRIKLISVTKDLTSQDTYHFYGKSMVKGNVDEFNGTIKITNIRKFKALRHGCEDEYKYKGQKGEFILLGSYVFKENPKQNHSGVFKGTFCSNFFINKNNLIKYNDIENCSDSYTNNQFVGQWASYDGKLTQRCNWGDYRIPNSGDLNIGAGEFSPNDKYLKYGWQSRRDTFIDSNKVKGVAVENAKWWE